MKLKSEVKAKWGEEIILLNEITSKKQLLILGLLPKIIEKNC
jgi:hypothetical protein